MIGALGTALPFVAPVAEPRGDVRAADAQAAQDAGAQFAAMLQTMLAPRPAVKPLVPQGTAAAPVERQAATASETEDAANVASETTAVASAPMPAMSAMPTMMPTVMLAAVPAAVPAAPAAPAGAAPTGDVRRATNDPAPLDPQFRTRLDRVVTRMRAMGHKVEVTETLRSQERQNDLYEQGRTRGGPVVTWTRNSRHTEGRAADIKVNGTYDDPRGYADLQRVAREEGLRTLGAKDPGHVELDVEGSRRHVNVAGHAHDLSRDLMNDPAALPMGGSRLGRGFHDVLTTRERNALGAVPAVAPAAPAARIGGVTPVAPVAPVASVASVAQVARVATVAQVAVPGTGTPAPVPNIAPTTYQPTRRPAAQITDVATSAAALQIGAAESAPAPQQPAPASHQAQPIAAATPRPAAPRDARVRVTGSIGSAPAVVSQGEAPSLRANADTKVQPTAEPSARADASARVTAQEPGLDAAPDATQQPMQPAQSTQPPAERDAQQQHQHQHAPRTDATDVRRERRASSDSAPSAAPAPAPAATAGAPVISANGETAAPANIGAAQRMEQVRAAQSAAPDRSISSLQMTVEGTDGRADQWITVELSGNALGATIETADADAAKRLGANIGELARALEGRGLDPESLRVVNAGATDRADAVAGARTGAPVVSDASRGDAQRGHDTPGQGRERSDGGQQERNGQHGNHGQQQHTHSGRDERRRYEEIERMTRTTRGTA